MKGRKSQQAGGVVLTANNTFSSSNGCLLDESPNGNQGIELGMAFVPMSFDRTRENGIEKSPLALYSNLPLGMGECNTMSTAFAFSLHVCPSLDLFKSDFRGSDFVGTSRS
jgi:hypothetical protein